MDDKTGMAQQMNWNGIKLPDNFYYHDECVIIYHSDCRLILPYIPDKSIDLVPTSPPFNLGDIHHTGNFRFSPYDDNMPELEYQNWQIDILNIIFNKVKDGGSLCYQHKNRIKDGLMISPYQWLFKTNWLMKQEIVWFNRSQNFDRIRFYPMTERIYWLAKSPLTTLDNVLGLHDDWHIKPEGTGKNFPRAFPEKLAERVLCSFPNAELLCDPFLGSGTIAYCAKKLNRRCIGIEIEERYAEIAAKRCCQGVFDLR